MDALIPALTSIKTFREVNVISGELFTEIIDGCYFNQLRKKNSLLILLSFSKLKYIPEGTARLLSAKVHSNRETAIDGSCRLHCSP